VNETRMTRTRQSVVVGRDRPNGLHAQLGAVRGFEVQGTDTCTEWYTQARLGWTWNSES